MSATDSFFEEARDQSKVKAEIVRKYFVTWASIMRATQKRDPRRQDEPIGYVDLFAGPGRYKDGTISTPLQILSSVLESTDLTEHFTSIFNDKDDENVQALQSAIEQLSGIERLRHRPTIWHQEVGDRIAADFEKINTIPLLAFVDPWGYKGLTLRLVNAFLKNFGCECIFFFNYSRINAGLSNPTVRTHMAALFGEERTARLAVELQGMEPEEREATVVEELAESLREHGNGAYRYVLPFCFKDERGTRTKHHLILVTKHFKGYDKMKEIMDKASTEHEEGVPSFTYFPVARARHQLLFKLNSPLERLEGMMLNTLAGKSLTFEKIYETVSVDTPFVRKNFRDVLHKLEIAGAIRVFPPASQRQRRNNILTYGEKVVVTFPRS